MTDITTVDQQLITKRSLVIPQDMKYQCKQCDFETTSKGSLTTHQKSIHICMKYPCNVTSRQLRKHI